jgi:hypothetical protein
MAETWSRPTVANAGHIEAHCLFQSERGFCEISVLNNYQAARFRYHRTIAIQDFALPWNAEAGDEITDGAVSLRLDLVRQTQAFTTALRA